MPVPLRAVWRRVAFYTRPMGDKVRVVNVRLDETSKYAREGALEFEHSFLMHSTVLSV